MTAAPSLPPPLAPVLQTQRVHAVDTLRGFALLGILAMNIIAFALPMAAYTDPMLPALQPYQGPFTGLNKLAWWVAYLLFDTKMMTIFSMLFGAGLVLMSGRADAAPPPGAHRAFAPIFYRRLLWLFLIGMLHAYLIWYGDILTSYALCGLLLYPLRRLAPTWLILIGSLVLLVAVVITAGMGGAMMGMRTAAERIIDTGGTPSADEQTLVVGYHNMMQGMVPSPETIKGLVASMRGPYSQVLRANAPEAAMLQLFFFVVWTFWRTLGLMLIGMALMKLGVFAARRPARFYTLLIVLGYGLGLPIVYTGGLLHIAHSFDTIWLFLLDWHFNYFGSIGVALGHVGTVMLLCRAGALTPLRARFAAVGQMALTNYLMTSLICTFIFDGWGLGYFARFERGPLYLFVIAIWAFQLIISPVWLSYYRFGPMEWVWRSLTYWKRQPMRRSILSEQVAAT